MLGGFSLRAISVKTDEDGGKKFRLAQNSLQSSCGIPPND